MGRDVGATLADRLAALVAQVRRTDRMLHEGEPDAVHDHRVALRRSRSLLRTFRGVLPAAVGAEAERLVVAARWAGAELGPVRDREVVHARLAALLASQPPELVLGAVAARLTDAARRDARTGRERVTALLQDPRHAALLLDLEAFAAAAPFRDVPTGAVRAALRRDWRRLRRRARAADRLPAGSPAQETALHETRKAAKRARYAAEAVAPVLGEPATRLAALAERVQESLGHHRDTVVARGLLRELGVQAHLDGDNGFTFGRLHALEEAGGEAALADYRTVRPQLDRRRHRRALA